jgi:hypothetical protein
MDTLWKEVGDADRGSSDEGWMKISPCFGWQPNVGQ